MAERALATLLADPAAKRAALGAMPAPARRAAHQLAEAYGLTTASVGAEPGRHVVVYKARPPAAPAAARCSCLCAAPASEHRSGLCWSSSRPQLWAAQLDKSYFCQADCCNRREETR